MALEIRDGGTVRALTAAELFEASRLFSALPVAIEAANAIPLNGNFAMAQRAIAGAVALTIGTKLPGGSCTARFISDGTNIPAVAGAAAYNNLGFDNTQAGLVNHLNVWTDDGNAVYFNWSQPDAQVPTAPPPMVPVAPGAPTGVSGVAGDGSITFSGTAPASNGGAAIDLYRITVAPGGTTFTGATPNISATGLTNGTAYTATMAARNSVGYGPESAASAAVAPQAAPAGSVATRFAAMTQLAESGDAASGWNYRGTKGSGGYGCFGATSVAIPANTAGSFEIGAPAGGVSTAILGVKGNGSASGFATFLFGIQPLPGSATPRYAPMLAGATQAAGVELATIVPAANDRVRIRRGQDAGVWVLFLEISKNAGTSWTTIYRTGEVAGILYGCVDTENLVNNVTNVRSTGAV